MVQHNARFEQSGDTADMYERVRDRVSDAGHRTEEMVQEHPTASVMLAFGLGLGLGMLLVASLSSPPVRRKSWLESHLPDMSSLPNMPSMPNLPNKQQMQRYLPDALLKHLN